MDSKPACLDFALVGHQDNWDKIHRFTNSLRTRKDVPALALEDVKNVYPFIPPRELFHIEIRSANGQQRRGVYIETFISPDELDATHLRSNIKKVKEACAYAASLNIPVVSLGGFTSILLESDNTDNTRINNTFFTTGNTLTAAFIADAIEKVCMQKSMVLAACSMLIIGATGDIGTACARYFSPKLKELLICARRPVPLQKMAEQYALQLPVKWSVNINELLPQVDIIICVASSMLVDCDTKRIPAGAIICDAGYPKNIDPVVGGNHNIFWGGMGVARQGFSFTPDLRNELYSFPLPNIVHGCLVEAIILSMQNRHEAYSKGRGNITVEAMREILGYAALHGIETAPFFNASFYRN